MRAAVMGSPISHSLSPPLHRAAYREMGLTGWSYDAFECDEAALPGLLRELRPVRGDGPDDAGTWAGLSLTMPLKRRSEERRVGKESRYGRSRYFKRTR